MSQLAFPLLVLALSGSPAQAGFVGALRLLPFLLLSLPAGALVDRWNRKRVMILCDLGRVLIFASIPLAFIIGHLTVIHLYFAALLEGTFFTFFNLAETASLSNVVATEQLAAAAAQNEATYNFTSLVSPLLGGLLYALSRTLPFLADAISYTFSIGSLFFIHTSFQSARHTTPLRLRTEIREGLLWLWHQPLIRYLSLLTGGINLVFPSSELLVIVLAQRQHTSAAWIGVIFAIGGIGSIIGALLSALVQKKVQFGATIIGVCWLMVAVWPLYIIARNSISLALVFTGMALLGPIYNVSQFSYRTAQTPDELQGRVNSVFRLVAFSLPPMGLALTGILLQQFAFMLTVVAFWLFLLGLALATTLNTHVRYARSVAVG
ncbi:MAG: MFS transporter [Chloroflexota bacterium]|nr:MFS transporter [Chloroflexota bacterium]